MGGSGKKGVEGASSLGGTATDDVECAIGGAVINF